MALMDRYQVIRDGKVVSHWEYPLDAYCAGRDNADGAQPGHTSVVDSVSGELVARFVSPSGVRVEGRMP